MKTQSIANRISEPRASALLAFALLTTTAHAATLTLDQSVVPPIPPVLEAGIGSPGTPFELDTAQTFTVGVAGLLSRVDVFAAVETFYGHTATLNWDVRPVSALQSPSDNDVSALAKGTLTLTANSKQYSFLTLDLSQTPVSVSVGERLAIVLSTSNGSMGWGGFAAVYAGGEPWQRSTPPNNGFAWLDYVPEYDLGFRTFVAVPEPSVLALVSIGAIVLATRGVHRVLERSAKSRSTITLLPSGH